LTVILEERPGDIQLAWEAIKQLGPGWVKRIQKALSSTSSPHKAIFERAKTFFKRFEATGFASLDPPER